MITNFNYRVVDVRVVNNAPTDSPISLKMSLQRKIGSFENGAMSGSFRLIITRPESIDANTIPNDFLVMYTVSFVAEDSEKDIDADAMICSVEKLIYSNMRAEINSFVSAIGMSPLGLPLFTSDFR